MEKSWCSCKTKLSRQAYREEKSKWKNPGAPAKRNSPGKPIVKKKAGIMLASRKRTMIARRIRIIVFSFEVAIKTSRNYISNFD